MTTESQSVESHGNNTNPHPVIIRLQNRKNDAQKNCRFDEAFNIFDEINNNHNKLNDKPRTSYKDSYKKYIAKIFENHRGLSRKRGFFALT